MTDIISTFPALHGPDRKRRLPSEQASEELFEGMREAMHGAAAGSAGPSKAGTGMQMLTGGLGGLSEGIKKMTEGPSTPMAPTMISDPIQVERDLSQLTGLPMYYNGGRIRRGQAGVVGDEIVEVDEEGATVIPAERMVSRTPEGELDVEARYEELEDAGQTARPDTRALLSRPSGYEQEFGGEQLGVQQTADPLAQKEAELAEAMKVKPSKWKDFGFSLLSGLNNYLNGARENRSYSEIKRDRRVAQIAPQVELLRQQKKREQEAQEQRLNTRVKTAQAANLEAQPGDRDAERERKIIKDIRDYEIRTRTADWKEEDRKKYWEWEAVKNEAKVRNDDRNYELAVRKQQELERANKAKENLTVNRETNLNRRQQIAIEAKRTLEEFKAAQAAGRQEKALEAKAKLAKLKEENDGLSATGEGIPKQ